jgi:hypothetical protein
VQHSRSAVCKDGAHAQLQHHVAGQFFRTPQCRGCPRGHRAQQPTSKLPNKHAVQKSPQLTSSSFCVDCLAGSEGVVAGPSHYWLGCHLHACHSPVPCVFHIPVCHPTCLHSCDCRPICPSCCHHSPFGCHPFCLAWLDAADVPPPVYPCFYIVIHHDNPPWDLET